MWIDQYYRCFSGTKQTEIPMIRSMNLKMQKCNLYIINYKPGDILLYDVAVIQWLTSCHRMTTRYIALDYWRVTSWCLQWQRYVFHWNSVNFKGDNHMLNRILHSWSSHMKFWNIILCLRPLCLVKCFDEWHSQTTTKSSKTSTVKSLTIFTVVCHLPVIIYRT